MITPAPIALRAWSATSQNTLIATGRIELGGRPVSGVTLTVDGYRLQQRTDAAGRFRYRIDTTLARRRVVTVASAVTARVGGRLMSSAERAAVGRLKGSFEVAYRITGLHASLQNGNVVVTGRASLFGGGAPPPVVLYTYRLSGTVTDSDGRPVAGAVVVSRTQDRDFWTSSTATDAHGRYTSFFAASDEAGSNPVPITVQVAVGSETFASEFGSNVMFPALRSASLDLKLPASPSTPLPVAKPSSRAGAVYEGVMVGVSGPHGVVKPLSATWPDRSGHFRLVLPATARGASLSVWEDPHQESSPPSLRARVPPCRLPRGPLRSTRTCRRRSRASALRADRRASRRAPSRRSGLCRLRGGHRNGEWSLPNADLHSTRAVRDRSSGATTSPLFASPGASRSSVRRETPVR